jgi:glutathione S-transferase
MNENDLTLWGSGTVRQLRAHWMLMEMNLDYEFIPIRPRVDTTLPDFERVNPRRKVPVLRHKDLLLTESAAIVHYLAEAFDPPASVYVPRDAAGRAKVNEWSYFVMTELDAHSLYVIRRHTDLKHLYGDAPAAVAAAREYFLNQLEAMRSRIGENQSFLLGERLSGADILLTTCLDWACTIDLPLPEEVRAYHQRAVERPAYSAARSRTFG